MRILLFGKYVRKLSLVGLVLVVLASVSIAQHPNKPSSSSWSIDSGILTNTGYVNDELGLEMALPSDVMVLMADGLSGAPKRIANALKTGDAKSDKRLNLQENTSRVLLKVDLSRPLTFLSIAVGKATPENTKSLAASTRELLLKTGQYLPASSVDETRISGQPIVFFTVKKAGSEPASFWKLYAFKRNGFQITVGLVYSSQDGMNELEKIVENIRFISK